MYEICLNIFSFLWYDVTSRCAATPKTMVYSFSQPMQSTLENTTQIPHVYTALIQHASDVDETYLGTPDMEKKILVRSIEYTQATGALKEAKKAYEKVEIKIGSRGIIAH